MVCERRDEQRADHLMHPTEMGSNLVLTQEKGEEISLSGLEVTRGETVSTCCSLLLSDCRN